LFATPIHPDFWWGVGVATAIAAAATLRLRFFRVDEYRQMSWMDWCGHYALLGIAILLLSAFVDWQPLSVAGLLLFFPLYPIALLGVIGKLDDMRASLLRDWRRR